MCYHCATNPSIHHRCCCIAAVSSPLSHHGVTFTVTLLQFHCCHCDVAFIVALLRCRCHSRVVAVPSLSHCCGFVVPVTVSPLSSHCRSFVITVVVLPSRLSWFRHCCYSVAFTSVVVLSLPSSEKINFSYYILLHLITSYSSYFGGKKGISGNKTSFFLLMYVFLRF